MKKHRFYAASLHRLYGQGQVADADRVAGAWQSTQFGEDKATYRIVVAVDFTDGEALSPDACAEVARETVGVLVDALGGSGQAWRLCIRQFADDDKELNKPEKKARAGVARPEKDW